MSTFASPITPAELEGISKLRNLFGTELPSDLNTDFNLRRWITGWKGNLREIEPRLRAYIQNRRTLNLDDPNLVKRAEHDPIMQKFLRHVTMGIHTVPLVNPKDNTVVVFYGLDNVDPDALTRMFTPSEYLYTCLFGSEIIMRQVLEQEATSGRQSGLTVLYDMHEIHYGHYINPNSAHMKLMALMFQVQQDCFCDMIHQSVCIRAPAFMSVLWSVLRHLLNEGTQAKFHIYTDNGYRAHLFEHMDPSCVPRAFGGEYREDTTRYPEFNLDADRALSLARNVEPEELFRNTWTPEEWTIEYVKPGKTFTVVKKVEEKDVARRVLRWQFIAHSNVDFVVYYSKDNDSDANKARQMVIPKLTLITPHFPEENQLRCKDYGAGDYVFEFSNFGTSWFSLKLAYCILESDQ